MEHCYKCGKALKSKHDTVDWDISGSTRRYVCRECAEEEGILSEDIEESNQTSQEKQKTHSRKANKG